MHLVMLRNDPSCLGMNKNVWGDKKVIGLTKKVVGMKKNNQPVNQSTDQLPAH